MLGVFLDRISAEATIWQLRNLGLKKSRLGGGGGIGTPSGTCIMRSSKLPDSCKILKTNFTGFLNILGVSIYYLSEGFRVRTYLGCGHI